MSAIVKLIERPLVLQEPVRKVLSLPKLLCIWVILFAGELGSARIRPGRAPPSKTGPSLNACHSTAHRAPSGICQIRSKDPKWFLRVECSSIAIDSMGMLASSLRRDLSGGLAVLISDLSITGPAYWVQAISAYGVPAKSLLSMHL